MSTKIWYCDAFFGATFKHLLPFFSALNAERGGSGNHYGAMATKEELNTYKRNDLGEPLPADCFPTKVFNVGPWKYEKKINPIMNNGFLFVRGDAADIIQEHDMGNGALYPVQLFETDQKSQLDVEMYMLNVGNVKKTICLERSELRKVPYQPNEIFRIESSHKSNDTTVIACREALDGPDIWVDPAIKDKVFISDRLAKAFKAAALTRTMMLRAVRVDDGRDISKPSDMRKSAWDKAKPATPPPAKRWWQK